MSRRKLGEEIACHKCGILTRNKVYCSQACQTESYRLREIALGNRVALKCEQCGVEFWIQKSDTKIHPHKRYCSRKCKDIHQSFLYSGDGNPLFGKTPSAEQLNNRRRRIMLNSAKRRSKKMGVEFNLTLDDIIIPNKCPLLEIELFNGNGSHCSNSPSLDRIDSSLGYIKGNVHVISFRANTIKQDATIDELQLLINNLKSIWPKSE